MLVLGRVVTYRFTTTEKRDLFVLVVNKYSCIVATSGCLRVPWTFKVAPELSMALLSGKKGVMFVDLARLEMGCFPHPQKRDKALFQTSG